MSDITGFDNENEFVKYLNGKTVGKLNPMFRELIDVLYVNPKEDCVLKSWLNELPQKAEFFVKINETTKGISLKKGIKNSVHVEGISQFVHFLIENNISKDIVVNYLNYHYADGTINGTGTKRISVEEYKNDHQYDIDRINKVFNEEKILKEAINRFILKGNNSDYQIDAIIAGEIDDFLWATRDDIEKIILSKKNSYSTGVHFGPITCQPKNRCLNYNPKYEKDRFSVQLKWYSLYDDIIEMMNEKQKQL